MIYRKTVAKKGKAVSTDTQVREAYMACSQTLQNKISEHVTEDGHILYYSGEIDKYINGVGILVRTLTVYSDAVQYPAEPSPSTSE